VASATGWRPTVAEARPPEPVRRQVGVQGRLTLAATTLVALVLALHVFDLTRHDRRFIRTTFVPTNPHTEIEEKLKPIVGSHRTAIDVELSAMFNRRFDDIGFFDSIVLARPYRTILDLWGAPPILNTQNFNGSVLRPDRLAPRAADRHSPASGRRRSMRRPTRARHACPSRSRSAGT